MIDRNKIVQLIEEKLTDDQFIVSVSISTSNQISVLLDSDKGITISDCVNISRQIEGNLDREDEDFELSVSSAGLDQPFTILRQYKKNLGKEVEVVFKDGQKLKGVLKQVDENNFELETSKKEKVEGKKKKITVTQIITIGFDDVKTVKNIIKF